MIQVIFQMNVIEILLFLAYNSFIVKLKKNVLIEAHKKNKTKQHSELFYWTSNEQFKSKMDLPLEKVSKITSASLTNW